MKLVLFLLFLLFLNLWSNPDSKLFTLVDFFLKVELVTLLLTPNTMQLNLSSAIIYFFPVACVLYLLFVSSFFFLPLFPLHSLTMLAAYLVVNNFHGLTRIQVCQTAVFLFFCMVSFVSLGVLFNCDSWVGFGHFVGFHFESIIGLGHFIGFHFGGVVGYWDWDWEWTFKSLTFCPTVYSFTKSNKFVSKEKRWGWNLGFGILLNNSL